MNQYYISNINENFDKNTTKTSKFIIKENKLRLEGNYCLPWFVRNKIIWIMLLSKRFTCR